MTWFKLNLKETWKYSIHRFVVREVGISAQAVPTRCFLKVRKLPGNANRITKTLCLQFPYDSNS